LCSSYAHKKRVSSRSSSSSSSYLRNSKDNFRPRRNGQRNPTGAIIVRVLLFIVVNRNLISADSLRDDERGRYTFTNENEAETFNDG